MPRRRRRSRYRDNDPLPVWIFLVVVGIVGITLLYNAIKSYLPTIGLLIAIVAVAVIVFFTIKKITRFRRRKRITGEMHEHLLKALKAMDSTAKTYTNEEEANKELVVTLKVQGFDAEYQFYLGDQRTADARVENVIVEGKLAPRTNDVDRLLGQLQGYSQYPYKVYVVIYGHISSTAVRRIEQEIDSRYLGKAFLTYLPNPRRVRA